MPTRPIVRRLRAEPLLALGSVLAFLAVLAGVELALRGFDRRYLDRARGPDVYSSRLGWRLRPGYQGPVHDVWTTINASGYRGREHAGPPAPGRTRVVMLGDSITFGHRLADEQTFPAVLEARSPLLEVVNLGTGMREIHTTKEWLKVSDMVAAAEVTLAAILLASEAS